jgi:murein DD-endopeptidase MepM/ murein hydrolase activator NlpD
MTFRAFIARLRLAVLGLAASAVGGLIAMPSADVEPAVAGSATVSVVPAQASGVPSDAQGEIGGVSAPGDPLVEAVTCKTACPVKRRNRRGEVKVRTGSVIKLKGSFLDYVEYVVFRGASGPLPSPLTYGDAVRVRAKIPEGAISSKPYVVDHRGIRSNRAPRKLSIRTIAPAGEGVFPVQGPHTFGGAGSRFGAPRSGHTHQGQDVAAACGTPLVAAMTATVQYAGYQGAAGNYIVIDVNGSSVDLVYMHMAYPATVRTVNAPVAAGQQVGVVGDTGNSEGCHLHFEYWEGNWYGGGTPVDPLPYLQAWDAAS